MSKKTPKPPKHRTSFTGAKDKVDVKKMLVGFSISVAVVLAGGAGVGLAVSSVSVPEAAPVNSGEVCAPFAEQQINCVLEEVFHDSVPRDELISQSIDPGWKASAPETITLTYSKGAESSPMPEVVGMDVEQARAALYSAGLEVGVVEFAKDKTNPAGTVLITSIAAGETVKFGDTVDLVVVGSTVDLPDWVGATKKQAEADAGGLGVSLIIEEEESKKTPGTILSQYPEAGEIEAGSEVRITISKEIKETDIKVPDVLGDTSSEAQSKLAEAGFRFISTVEVENTEVSATQVTQVVPGVGQTVSSSTQIVIIVSTPSS